MRNPLRAAVLVICLALVSLPASAQEPAPVVTWQTLVNQARLDEGLAFYGFSALLAAAAQRHADDLAAHQIWSHTGSDDSSPSQRIAEAGYAAWTWNGGESITSENFWTGYGTVEDAMAFFLEDPPHRDNILSATYREMGVGVATDAPGRNYYVLDFGARPNVLPVFINDGAVNADDPQVAIRLTNEEARPGGKGATFMGRAIEIRISNEPEFDDLPWQPWEPLVPWALPDTSGEHTVYVQFRDAAGRTAAAVDAIVLGEGAVITPTPVTPSPTPEPTATPIPPSPTPEPTATSAPPSPTFEPTATPEPTVVLILPEPAATLASAITSTPESPPGVETLPANHTPRPAPFPTWTPLPPTLPREDSGPGTLLVVLVALQGLALVLGICLALYRGRV